MNAQTSSTLFIKQVRFCSIKYQNNTTMDEGGGKRWERKKKGPIEVAVLMSHRLSSSSVTVFQYSLSTFSPAIRGCFQFYSVTMAEYKVVI